MVCPYRHSGQPLTVSGGHFGNIDVGSGGVVESPRVGVIVGVAVDVIHILDPPEESPFFA